MSPRALLFAELSDGMRTGRFWAIVARNAIPLAGVVWLGWPAGLLVVFYVIDIWWFLSLRMAAEIAVEDELKGDTPMSAGRLTGLTLVKFLPGALVIGVLFFTVASLFIVALFTHWDWRAFVTSLDRANRTRAVIRLPLGARAKFVIAVGDLAGNILTIHRMLDSTVFSIDV